jgi:hypothetical protein
VTTPLIEHLDMPATDRTVRAFATAGDRVDEVLAGRTLWCASAPHGTRQPVDVLVDRLHEAGPGIEARALTVSAATWLAPLVLRLDRMLAGTPVGGPELGGADRALYGEGLLDGEALMGSGVQGDDVVVIHDSASALIARAARERGARAVWHLRIAGPGATAAEALGFLRRFTQGVDAYIVAWTEAGRRATVEYVATVMPGAGIVAAEEFRGDPPQDASRRLAWRIALAEAVRTCRSESVGGTLRPRPAVPAR